MDPVVGLLQILGVEDEAVVHVVAQLSDHSQVVAVLGHGGLHVVIAAPAAIGSQPGILPVHVFHELVGHHVLQDLIHVAGDLVIQLPAQEPLAVLQPGIALEYLQRAHVRVQPPQEGDVLRLDLENPVGAALGFVQGVLR